MTWLMYMRALSPRSWPISVRVPAVVALFMVVVSVSISNLVLSRLEDTQRRNLQELASAYLDGLSASLIPSVVRDDVWEVFDTLDRARERYRAPSVRWTAVTGVDGKIIAASDPVRFKAREPLPTSVTDQFNSGIEVTIREDTATAYLARPLTFQKRDIGSIYAEADIHSLLAERSEVFAALVLTNLLLTIGLVVLGYLTIRRMLGPVSVLSRHLEKGTQGAIDVISERTVQRQSREYRRLFTSYNALATALREREALTLRLAEEEKLASLGRLASGMAHEINNPLGGMFNALDALKRHGEREGVRATSIRLIEQGLSGIRDLVRSTLATYRAEPQYRSLTATDLDDLSLLIKPEVKRRSLELVWANEIEYPVAVNAVPLRDAVLNLLLNACDATPAGGTVSLLAREENGKLIIEINDGGPGIPADIREYIERHRVEVVPLDRRSGLGLWIVKRLCAEIGARLEVVKSSPQGSTVRMLVDLQRERLTNVA